MKLSPGGQLLFSFSIMETLLTGCKAVETEHLFLALCKSCDLDENERAKIMNEAGPQWELIQGELQSICEFFRARSIDLKDLRRKLRRLLAKEEALKGKFAGHRSDRCRGVFREAESRCRVMGESRLMIPHILWALLSQGSPRIREAFEPNTAHWEELCQACGVDPAKPLKGKAGLGDDTSPAGIAAQGQAATRIHARAEGSEEKAERPVPRGSGEPGKEQAKAKPSTPFLEKFGRDLTALAREGQLAPCIGRKGEMRSMAQVLRRQMKSNVVLVGDAGVGKTCIVEGLAQRIVVEGAPEAIGSWRIIEISMGNLIAGAMYQGQFEERLQTMIREAGSDPNIILFIDELHTMVGAGGAYGKGMDAGQILKPALARGEIRIIGATTTPEYRKFIEPDGALERRFQMVWVNEPSRSEAFEILHGLRPRLQDHHGVEISPEVLERAVEWSMRYLPDHRLPDKAIDLIDQACARRALATLSPIQVFEQDTEAPAGIPTHSLTEEDIAEVISERCQVPVGAICMDEAERLLHMEEALAARVKGQDEALRQVADAVRTARAGLKKPERPAAVFLFLGATGTGKTELAKALAEFLFATEEALIRFDMSEYGEKHNVARLIGAPPGYIGHDEEGQLIGRVRTRPYSVILFDEIEKAHKDVFDIFLQIFDDGRLTDGKGRRAVFSESVIILTSNLGSSVTHDASGKGMGISVKTPTPYQRTPTLPPGQQTSEAGKDLEAYCEGIRSAVQSAFRAEFLNRIGHQVIFYPLGRDIVLQILDKLVQQLNDRLSDRDISVEVSPEAANLLIEEGYSDTYGARELERVFEKRVGTPLAKQLLEGKIPGGRTVRVDLREGDLVLE